MVSFNERVLQPRDGVPFPQLAKSTSGHTEYHGKNALSGSSNPIKRRNKKTRAEIQLQHGRNLVTGPKHTVHGQGYTFRVEKTKPFNIPISQIFTKDTHLR